MTDTSALFSHPQEVEAGKVPQATGSETVQNPIFSDRVAQPPRQ